MRPSPAVGRPFSRAAGRIFLPDPLYEGRRNSVRADFSGSGCLAGQKYGIIILEHTSVHKNIETPLHSVTQAVCVIINAGIVENGMNHFLPLRFFYRSGSKPVGGLRFRQIRLPRTALSRRVVIRANCSAASKGHQSIRARSIFKRGGLPHGFWGSVPPGEKSFRWRLKL